MTRLISNSPTVLRARVSGWPLRRRLFDGPVDDTEQERTLQEMQKRLEQEQNERWGFDFRTEKPIEGGRYIWSMGSGKRSRPESCPGPDKSDDPPHPPEGDDDGKGGQTIKIPAEESLTNEVQTLITDFMRKRKFPSEQKESVASLKKISRRSTT